MITELQKNSKINLLRTLNDFVSQYRQVKYKESVPFVHVPIELLTQWDQYSRLIQDERRWFLDIFTQDELFAMRTFDMAVENFHKLSGDDIEDIPEIFQDGGWLSLQAKASNLLNEIKLDERLY